MKIKLFESSINTGYKYGYTPLSIISILLIVLTIKFLFFYYTNLPIFNSIGILIFIVISLEIFLFKQFQNKRRLILSRGIINLEVDLKENGQIRNYPNIEIQEWYWSYKANTKNNSNDLEFNIDPLLNEKEGIQNLKSTGQTLEVVLTIIIKSENNKLILIENLENYENLPSGWNYKLLNFNNFKKGIEVFKLSNFILEFEKKTK